jgi:anti-anti-sigma factor
LEREFEVEVRPQARGTVVTVSGELDVASSQVLERELAELPNVAVIVVDLGALSFIDSTGLGVLVRAHQLALEQGRRFGLVRAGAQVSRVLSLTGLDEEVLLGDSVEELLSTS